MPGSRGNGLPDFLGTGMVTALHADTNRASARMTLILRWYIAGRIMSLLDFWVPLTTSPGPGTRDLYLADHPVPAVFTPAVENSVGKVAGWLDASKEPQFPRSSWS